MCRATQRTCAVRQGAGGDRLSRCFNSTSAIFQCRSTVQWLNYVITVVLTAFLAKSMHLWGRTASWNKRKTRKRKAVDTLFHELEFYGGEGACKTHVPTKQGQNGTRWTLPLTGAKRKTRALTLALERIWCRKQCQYNVFRGLSTFDFERQSAVFQDLCIEN